MDKNYYHYDAFELFGKKFHRVILIPDEPVFKEINSFLKQKGFNVNGFFWKKAISAIATELNIGKETDFDAEKDACIICHESKDELMNLTHQTYLFVNDPVKFNELLANLDNIIEDVDEVEDNFDDLI